MLLLGYILVTCHKNNIVPLHVTFILYRRNKTCLLEGHVTIGDRVNTRERGSLAILPRPCFQTVERIRDALTRGKSELQNRKIILCNASTP